MQTPIQIDFQGVDTSESVRESLLNHVAELEDKFGRITAGRVVLKGPGARHRQGGLYEVNIWLTLPGGREVAVVRTPRLDERHADLAFAINDAFHRARRQLQDQVRRMRKDVKTHDATPVGTVVRLTTPSDHGFLSAPDGHEVYFHRNSVLNRQFGRLKVGDKVAFVEEAGDKGPQASTVRRLPRQPAGI
ncbi:cold shock domain-containing protein [Alsobacter sp. SYSU M60028]|uniref:Cold shock domain-containing protein n=1 Tax=Alsobacter ponti TaxID=2962936 RepID=A0ABT1LF45_9HYPH|nr:HPF/RaiA family ribosome-associated protein [Alsobacter ponti]MCP8940117.1 cold shock domain-containing protein [Alsobacter ponti]